MSSYQYRDPHVKKIRRSRDRLIFNMGIPIHGKNGLYIETASCFGPSPRCRGWLVGAVPSWAGASKWCPEAVTAGCRSTVRELHHTEHAPATCWVGFSLTLCGICRWSLLETNPLVIRWSRLQQPMFYWNWRLASISDKISNHKVSQFLESAWLIV